MLTPAKLTAIEHAFDGIALLDKSGNYMYMNKAHADLFGYDSADELYGKSWQSIYTPEAAERLQKEVFPVLGKNGNWSGETIGISKDKKPVMQYISLTSLPDGGMVCVCRDNSKAINANRLQYLMSNLGKGILVEDENHCVVLVNRQFCNLFQIPVQPHEMIGVNCLDSLQQSLALFKDAEKVKTDIFSMMGKQEPLIGQEVVFNDGRILERDYVPIIIENTFKGQLWSYTDVTQNRQLQKSLVDAKNRAIASEKAKSAFLSNMSHEIRTPMNAIMGLAEQLSMSQLNEQQHYFVKNISDAAHGLLGIINDILDMSKIEAGKMSIEKEIVSLKDINKSVENILRPKAKEKGLNFETDFDRKIDPNLFADEVRIRQVLINIVGNAIKFTDSGSIKLSSMMIEEKNQTQRILFTCEDSGIGISEEGLKHIFDDFYQEVNENNHRHTGSGLGLAITRTLVNLMGGEIWIESTKDVGTKVMVEISFEMVAADELMKDAVEFDDCGLIEGKKILIVEDNKLNRMLFALMVKNMKGIPEEAENGLEAVEMINKNKYDLVLMDVQMPIMDGPTALALIRKSHGETIPVIALTAAAFKSEVNHMLNLGFADCITKPIDQKNLQHRLCLFFKTGSVKEKYYQSIHKKIIANISEMAGNEPAQLAKMMEYLLDEVGHALGEWQISVPASDWASAKRTLHREKVMIKSIGINGFDGLIREIEDDTIKKTESEMTLMYSQLIDLFHNLQKRIGEK
ncbi:MAG: ATP-binding protein [bacterium]